MQFNFHAREQNKYTNFPTMFFLQKVGSIFLLLGLGETQVYNYSSKCCNMDASFKFVDETGMKLKIITIKKKAVQRGCIF